MKSSPPLLAAALLLSAAAWAGDPPMPALPEGRRLREIVAEKFPEGNVWVGGTTGWGKLGNGSGTVLDREFSYVTPENDFKQSTIHPGPDRWDWSAADAWVRRCAEKGQVLRIHGPIGPQCSRWATDDARTAEELSRNLEEFLTALCKRYGSAPPVKWLDVVNEVVLPDGRWLGPKPGTDAWENPWPKTGYDEGHPLKPPLYLKTAFRIAQEHAPRLGLIFNQNAGMDDPLWGKVKATVLYLREQGLRVDGIGWQAHVDVGWETASGNLERLASLIDWAHANRLSFHVTECNVWLKGKKDYAAQAETFAAIFKALLAKRRSGVVTWNVWNIGDASSWHSEWSGCLFSGDFTAKPAYYAIQQLLMNPP